MVANDIQGDFHRDPGRRNPFMTQCRAHADIDLSSASAARLIWRCSSSVTVMWTENFLTRSRGSLGRPLPRLRCTGAI